MDKHSRRVAYSPLMILARLTVGLGVVSLVISPIVAPGAVIPASARPPAAVVLLLVIDGLTVLPFRSPWRMRPALQTLLFACCAAPALVLIAIGYGALPMGAAEQWRVTLLIEPLAILAVVMFARAVSETVLTPSPPGFTVATEVICVLGILVLLARPGLAASLVAAVIAILAGANLLVLVARRPRAERQRLAPTADGDPNG